MKTVTIYKKNTGEILRSFSGSEELIAINVRDDEDYVEGIYTIDDEKVVNGILVPLTDKEIELRNIAAAWQALKTERNLALQASDWTQVPDAPVDQAAWAAYRQALRDLPSSTTDPRNPVWPEPPTSDKIAPNHEVNT